MNYIDLFVEKCFGWNHICLYLNKEKSRTMKKFFSSPKDFGLTKILHSLDVLLTEQRHQRMDLSTLRKTQLEILNSLNLQKQVDQFFEEDEKVIAEVPLEDMAQDGNSSNR